MRKLLLVAMFAFTSASVAQRTPAAARPYYPGPAEQWERRTPQQAGMDAAQLQEAIDFAVANESKLPRNLEPAHYQTFGREPFGQGVGPFKERGAPTGVVIRGGYLVAEWGDTSRVDMTFSVTKSFLSSVVGLAYDRKMIRSLEDRVRDYMPPVLSLAPNQGRAESLGQPQLLEPFKTEHNRKITWEHMLRQTSDWEGMLWGKPEWADRPSGNPSEWLTRKAQRAGHGLRVQRRAGERAGAGGALRLAAAAAAGAARVRDGRDRRLFDVALVRVRDFVGGAERPGGAVCERRRPLGRRAVHQRPRHGALRASHAAAGAVAGQAGTLRGVAEDGD
jgi:hypothetical protein